MFGRGGISTEAPEFAISFSADGATAYFNRATPDRSKLAIVASQFVDGAWQAAQPLPFSTGEHRDVDPFVTGDGALLYFSSNRPRGADAGEAWNTWVVARRGDGWTDPELVAGAASGDDNETFVSVARDGTLYYGSDRSTDGGGGGGDLFRARGPGAAGEPLGSPINTEHRESNPAISPDGAILVFVADRPDGLGGADLYVAHHREGRWTVPRNLGATVNSPFADFAPYISPDGRYLFFTSERPGVAPAVTEGRPPGDIYQIDLVAALGGRETRLLGAGLAQPAREVLGLGGG